MSMPVVAPGALETNGAAAGVPYTAAARPAPRTRKLARVTPPTSTSASSGLASLSVIMAAGCPLGEGLGDEGLDGVQHRRGIGGGGGSAPPRPAPPPRRPPPPGRPAPPLRPRS